MTSLAGERTAAEAAVADLPLPSVLLDGTELSAEALATLGPLRVRLEASAPAVCELEFDLDPQAARPGRGQSLRVWIGTDAAEVFEGEVVALTHRLGPDGRHRVRLRGFDRGHRMRQRSAVTAHTDVTVAALAETLAGEQGLGSRSDADGPRWPRVVQHGESDLELLSRLAARSGLWWQVVDGDLVLRPWRVTDRYEVSWGIDLVEAEVTDDGTAEATSVRALGWDPVQRTRVDGEASGSEAGAPRPGGADVLGGNGSWLLPGAVLPSDEHADALAQSELDRRTGAALTVRAVVRGDAKWRPGCGLVLAGQPEELAGPFLLTAVEHVVDAHSGYLCLLSSRPLDPPPAATGAASAFGLAVVTEIDDPDRAGRVKVRFPALDDVESEWLPVLSLGAGEDKGLLCQPDVDDTVLVLYATTDPGRGVVLGGLYADHLPADAAGVEQQAVRRFGWANADGQRLLFNRDGDLVVVSNGAGSLLEFGEHGVRLHAEQDLTIEAPGKRLVLRADTVDFERG